MGYPKTSGGIPRRSCASERASDARTIASLKAELRRTRADLDALRDDVLEDADARALEAAPRPPAPAPAPALASDGGAPRPGTSPARASPKKPHPLSKVRATTASGELFELPRWNVISGFDALPALVHAKPLGAVDRSLVR